MLKRLEVQLVRSDEEGRFHRLMQEHHYLGSLRKIGETLLYVATYCGAWLALLSFSAAALKIAARDQFIGWSYRQQNARLRLVANNTRFCVLPAGRVKNLASRTLALCERRLSRDWSVAFGHPIVLLETFVDSHHRGTLYRAANWTYVGETRGFRRITGGYSPQTQAPKKIFVRPLDSRALSRLCQADFKEGEEGARRVLKAEHLRILPSIFQDIPDPRRAAGRVHPLAAVLSIVAGAYLCGVRGHKAIGVWAEQLTQSARAGLRCRCERNHYRVPSATIILDVMRRVDREQLEHSLQSWNSQFAANDASLTLHAHALLGGTQS